MTEIIRYCMSKEEHEGDNVFKVCRPNIMGNPFTYLPKKQTKFKNLIKVKSREDAVRLYEPYFDSMVTTNPTFQAEWDRMFSAYLKYDKIYIGCFCDESEPCHGDIIIKKLRQRAIKQMLNNLSLTNN